MNGIVARGTDSAKVIQVIETVSSRGKGTEENPCRWVHQYWSLEGELLAENDPCKVEERRCIKTNFCEKDEPVELSYSKEVKEAKMTVAVSDGQCGSVEQYHTEKELRDVVLPLLDERVISVDITKRAPERGPSHGCEISME